MSRSRVLVGGLLALTLCGVGTAPARAEKAVLLVRHAEKASGGDDPELSEAGSGRAARLAEMLKGAGLTAVLSSDRKRTLLTARPAAAAAGVVVREIAKGDPAATLAAIDAAPADAVVLVVGHSNTIPEILTKLGGPAVTIDDADFGNLFVVVRAAGKPASVVRLRY